MNEFAPEPARGNSGTPDSTPKADVDPSMFLFKKFAKERDPNLRDQLVEKHQRLARYLASKFAGRGEPLDDLVQVANLGLIKSIDRFDVSRGLKFVTYATATIVGEIQRYFRDTTWRVKVPRAMQELNRRAATAKDTLTGRLGRLPTVAEVARELGTTEELTLEAIELDSAYCPTSLDSATTQEGTMSLLDLYGADDAGIVSMGEHDDLGAAIKSLGMREQNIVNYYFFSEMTETQIATKLCISQMHVSRLKKKALLAIKLHLSAPRSQPGDAIL